MGKKVKRSKASRLKPNELVLAGGRKRLARRKALRTGQAHGKFMDKKEGLKTRRFEIAHPDDLQGYVDQCGFVITWFREMFERVESTDEKAASAARVALMDLLFLSVKQLTALGLDNKNSSARWAWRLLAGIEVGIDKRRKKFGKGYEDLRRELSVVFRNDVWEPASPLYQALHRELWLCRFYRREIPFPKAQRYLPELKVPRPEEYRPLMKLPPLSLESWEDWEKHLWPLVKQHNPGLRALLQKRYKRAEFRWSKYRKEFRHHLRTIAAAASG